MVMNDHRLNSLVAGEGGLWRVQSFSTTNIEIKNNFCKKNLVK